MRRKQKLLLNLYTKAVAVFFLGFSSTVPVVLIFPTLNAWLAKAGLSYVSIGVFSVVGIPYIVKFLFAPFFDNYTVPLLGRYFGQKRGWILFLQPCVVLAIIGLSVTSPLEDIRLMRIFAILVAFLSSLQDIVIDNYRISLLRAKEQLIGSSSVLLGARFAYLISGALALFLVDYLCNSKGLCEDFLNWKLVYVLSAFLTLSASVVVLFMGEPKKKVQEENISESRGSFFLRMFFFPLREIYQMRQSFWIITVVIVYRSCDSLIATMISPFLIDIGFSLTEIAIVAKTFGLFSLVVGGFIGARIVYKHGIMKGLIVGGVLQMLSNVMFVVQAKVGYSLSLLYLTIAAENVCGSIATGALIGYISGLASRAYFSGTVYAIFSSLSLIDRVALPVIAGAIADNFGWTVLFEVSVILGIPSLLLVMYVDRSSRRAE